MATSAANRKPTAASLGSAPTSPRTSPGRSDARAAADRVRLRPASPADAAALGAIAEAAFAPYVSRIGRRPAPMDMDLAAAIATRRVIVAEAGPAGAREPVGYAVFDDNVDGAGFLESVAVHPDRQGRGIGARLVAAVEEAARRAGAGVVRLYNNVRMSENLALYPRLGYRETGRRTEEGFERVYFEKRLPPPVAVKRAVAGLYGRRRVYGHAIGPEYERYALDMDTPVGDVRALFPVPVQAVRLEVGFGAGEHLVHHARTAPGVGIIGVEPFETGVARAARDARKADLSNVRLHLGDARAVLDWLPDRSIERVDILYPDPWPKKRHWKRRFISMDTLDRIARVLVPGGTVRFASDIPSYVDWTREHVAAHPEFTLAGDSAEPWEGWPGTRYEEKALHQGRTPRYLTLALAR